MALRIKSDVDLKELEKFGFEYIEEDEIYGYYNKFVFIDRMGKEISYTIPNDTLEIKMSFDSLSYFRLDDTLYDLIKADLVEKVEE